MANPPELVDERDSKIAPLIPSLGYSFLSIAVIVKESAGWKSEWLGILI